MDAATFERLVSVVGIPGAMCLALVVVIYQGGKRLVDAHIKHMEEMSGSLKQITETQNCLVDKMDRVCRADQQACKFKS